MPYSITIIYYIECIAIRDIGFTYGEIELVKNGEVVAKGLITKK